MRRALTLFLLLVLAIGSARAEKTPTRLPVPKELPTRTLWFGVYVQGNKLGYGKVTEGTRGEGQDAVFVGRMEATMEAAAMGQTMHIELVQEEEFDVAPPQRFRGGHFRSAEGPRIQDVVVRREGDGLAATVTQAGAERKMAVPAIDYTLADRLTPESWVRTHPEVGAEITVRTFDLSELEADLSTQTIVGTKEAVVEGVKVSYYEMDQHSEKKGEEGRALMDREGMLISMTFGGAMEIRLEPEEVAKRLDAPSDLFLAGTVKIDKPLGEAPKVTDLVIELGGEGAAFLQDGPRQTVSRGDGAALLELGAAHGSESKATAEEIEESLAETVDYPVKAPEVVALAKRAVEGAATPREKVSHLVTFVSDYLQDVLCTEAGSVLDIILAKKGDCSEHALLFTALARAAGIPTREVSGLMYMGDKFQAFGGHAWDEVVLDGAWTPVDPTWNQVEVDATHVTTARTKKDDMQQLKLMGRLSFRLKTVKNGN